MNEMDLELPTQGTDDVKKLSYSDAINELGEILRKMQSNECDIDSLATMTKRAAELLKECRSRLTATEEELKEILDSINQ